MPNQYTKARETGIPYIMSEETRAKKSKATSADNKRRFSDPEYRRRHSESMKKAVLRNPDSYTASNVCGRVKVEEYNGEKFHGKWEVEVAKWFDSNQIKWERKVPPVNYFWNDSWHLYFPDFYLPEHDVYIEVKGYETERDLAKWSALPNLIVLKSKQIKEIRENKFVLITH